ncbi:MAG: hypothetical protein IT328_09685 [Caldilineaceae bacterium]|nr:hypothetical protein [Caldilineaceae bacterium]
MKTLLRLIVLITTMAVVLLLLFGGVFLETGNLDIMATRSLLPEVGSLQTIPISDTIEQQSAQQTGKESVLRFIWRGGNMLYDDNVIDETEFTALLVRAKANKTKVEIAKFPDVRGMDAYRWRQLLEDAGVQYEILPQAR